MHKTHLIKLNIIFIFFIKIYLTFSINYFYLMNFQHSKNLQSGHESLPQKISAMAFSPNSLRLAVAQSVDKKIALFDESGNKKEVFSTKAFKSKNYLIKDITFSPCSSKLAIAQSDNIVTIYNLGLKWGEKKTICNKFEQETMVNCIFWHSLKLNEIYIGLLSGKVVCGLLTKNSSSVLYSTESLVVSLACSMDGKFILSGHLDGNICKYNIENSNMVKLITHSSIPYCLSWGNDIFVSGSDNKVFVFNDSGNKLQCFDYSDDDKLKEFSVIKLNSNGDSVVIGNYNRFYIFMYNKRKQVWEEACVKNVDGLHMVTALAWKPDNSALITGNLSGSVDLFECFLAKKNFKEKFEIVYITSNQIMLKNKENNKKLFIKPTINQTIVSIKMIKDTFLIVLTKESLILGDINSEKMSEIHWTNSGKEKFDFSNPNVCMIFSSGEITLIEFGNNKILGYCRTEYIHNDLISVRISSSGNQLISGSNKSSALKIIAYLIDLNTIYVQDLVAENLLLSISHEEKIDYLEINKSGNKLVFRDRKKQLYLYNILNSKKSTLLNFCGFVKWVQNSDVLVAQDLKNICVWYNIDDHDKVTIIPIKGSITEIIRKEGKTEVIVNEGVSNQIYLLDDGLITFSTALDEENLEKAVKILEGLEQNSNTEAHWKTLAKQALNRKNLTIARRCYSAINSYSKSEYLKELIKVSEDKDVNEVLIQAKILILDKQFNNAENLLLENGLLNDAMDILNELQKWDESVNIAEKYSHPKIADIKAQYYKWLLDNDQLDKAAKIKESDGDYNASIKLYLKGGYPAKAANLVKLYGIGNFDNQLLENIVKTLLQVGIFDKAGEILELMGHFKRALEAYHKGACFSKAVELAKKNIQNMVEKLEEEWGDYLSSQKHNEEAIIHYIEGNCKDKAIEAAIIARKWDKAIELCNKAPMEIAKHYYADIGDHFAALHKMDQAEKYYLKSGEPILCLNMYIRYSKWDRAVEFAKQHLQNETYKDLIAREAENIEKTGKLKEAEKLYLIAEEYDVAITMYKDNKQYDNMIRLVSKYRPEYLRDTHLMVANLICEEKSANLKQAELHYLEANDWSSCAEMYKNHELWDDAMRVAKSYGNREEVNAKVKDWVKNLSYEEQKKKLFSLNMIDCLIDIEILAENFPEAFKLAEQYSKYKLPEIHLKFAIKLEYEKRYHEAEEHYVKAGQIMEVIQMYEYISDFNNALRIARQHATDYIPTIYNNQGKLYLEKKDYQKAEMCFKNANKPELMANFYMQNNMFEEALAFCRKHYPVLIKEILHIMGPRQQDLIEEQKKKEEDERLRKEYEESKKTVVKVSPEQDINGLEMLLERGDYERCLDLAMKNSDMIFNEFLIKIIEKYIKERNYISAAEFLERYETPIYKNNLNVYKILAEEILAEENEDELRSLKNMLFVCVKHLAEYPDFSNEYKYLSRLHKISYYQHIKAVMKVSKKDFPFSYYHVCMSILAYGDIIKFDLALLDAGLVAKEKGIKNVAFILLSRYVDLYEVIQDPSVKLESEKEFENTEIPQQDTFKSENNILSPEEKDNMQTWIVKTTVDKSIDFSLPKKDCPKCKKKIFEYNTICTFCSYTYDQCIITGYPINTQNECISCSNCKKKALKDSWKEWISTQEKCPWCNSIQISYK